MYMGRCRLLIRLSNVLVPLDNRHARDSDLLLPAALLMLIVAETTVVPILTSALGKKATSAALPSKVTKGAQRG